MIKNIYIQHGIFSFNFRVVCSDSVVHKYILIYKSNGQLQLYKL